MGSGIIQCMANLRYRNVQVVFSLASPPSSLDEISFFFFFFILDTLYMLAYEFVRKHIDNFYGTFVPVLKVQIDVLRYISCANKQHTLTVYFI